MSKSTGYQAAETESKWYQAWQSAGLFKPSGKAKSYCITIPPPNITGSLHMGHALCYSLHDLLGRYKRLTGHSVLILPGQDHAGIATQSIVDKQLRAEGTSASELGRDAFLERVWQWREQSGNQILTQLQALGCSFDWDRLRFTLDNDYAQAVLQTFVNWFDRGLIYKGLRVVNWDPTLKTSVSDIETERKIIQGKLYHIRYPFTDGSGHITIATTRPETMLADVAVAVHPKDKRYQKLIGKTLTLPLVNREIPLIADEYPDPEFGTGAVKITPGHDPNDFEVGQRHNLDILIILDEEARMTAAPYQGMDRFKARKAVVQDLEEQGFLEKIEDHEIAVLVSDRSKDVIEPLASNQWFVKQDDLVAPILEQVKKGEITFYPERYRDIFIEWMENIKDWCLSRQLWWGHRIPVYYTEDGDAFAAESWEQAQAKAGDKEIVRQDDDVLDTWFSSGLWPFATLGWPQTSEDISKFYPTNVLITARDILYLWVARMAMMSNDMVGSIPFKDVYIYATVLTEDGKRMSKSLGTGVDPMDLIQTIGADALRFTLLSQTGLNQEIRYSDRKSTDARNFCNKIWNASKFIMGHIEGAQVYQGARKEHLSEAEDQNQLLDQWILSRLAFCEQEVRQGYESYDISRSIHALHRFFWAELCDWYIEMCKSRLQAGEEAPKSVLAKVLQSFLILAHPAMPFITEEVYSQAPFVDKQPFLMQESWPEDLYQYSDPSVENEIERWLSFVRSVRALRAEIDITPLRKIPELYFQGDLLGAESIVASQAWIEQLIPGKPQEGKFISATAHGVDFHLPISGHLDLDAEKSRLELQLSKTNEELEKVQKRLQNPSFVERAKPEVVARDRELEAELLDKLGKIKERITLISG